MSKPETKMSKCRYCRPSFSTENNKPKIVHACMLNVKKMDDEAKIVTENDCESCESFKSKYIEYPIQVNKIENEPIKTESVFHQCGCLCEIQPCGDEKSYVGFYIGELPISIMTSYKRETGVLTNSTMTNPAIFVPELGKIVYGCESWWREIESIDDFKGISQEDIDNTWYVQLMKEMYDK